MYLTIVCLVSSTTPTALVVTQGVSCSVRRPMLANSNHVMTGVTTPEKPILNQKGNVKLKVYMIMNEQKADSVNHPAHYTWLKELCGIEVIDITRHMNFCLGNSIKYILRAGHKKDSSLTDTEKQIEDLNKAIWYLKDEIKRITEFNNKTKV